MLQAIESLLPIILLVILGAALSEKSFLNLEVRIGMDRFTYWIALPSLFLHTLSSTDFSELAAGKLILILMMSTLVVCLLAILLAAIMRMPKSAFGVFVQATFRGNLAFVGLPLIVFALKEDMTGELISEALLALAALIPLYNILSIILLISAQKKISTAMLPDMLQQLGKNPLIISTLAGGLLGWFQIGLPIIVNRPLELLGQTALALALVSLGGALSQLQIRGNIRYSLLASLMKVAAVPAVTYGLTLLISLPPDQQFIAMVLSACPTAAASYIMTTQLGGDSALAASSIVASTVFSMVALALTLIWF
ncbi:MAG: AEC family transporter [Balneolales bacterium]